MNAITLDNSKGRGYFARLLAFLAPYDSTYLFMIQSTMPIFLCIPRARVPC
jgi:hypothetical protein